MNIDLLSTIKGSLLENFLPRGWNLNRMDAIAALPPEKALSRASHWHARFEPVPAADLAEFEVSMGLEIAALIIEAAQEKRDERHQTEVTPLSGKGLVEPPLVLGDGAHVHPLGPQRGPVAIGHALGGALRGKLQEGLVAGPGPESEQAGIVEDRGGDEHPRSEGGTEAHVPRHVDHGPPDRKPRVAEGEGVSHLRPQHGQ